MATSKYEETLAKLRARYAEEEDKKTSSSTTSSSSGNITHGALAGNNGGTTISTTTTKSTSNSSSGNITHGALAGNNGGTTISTTTSKSTSNSSASKYESTLNKLKARYDKSASVDETYINTFLKDAQSFLNRSANNVNGLSWSSATSNVVYNSWKEEYATMKEKEEKIRSYLTQNKDKIDSTAYKEISSLLDTFHWSSIDARIAFNKANEYYSQWESEDAYNKAKKESEEYEALKNYDIWKGEREISDLEKLLDEYKFHTRWMTDENGEARAEYIRQNYGDEEGIEALIAEKKAYLNRARHIQEGLTLAGVIDNDDFKENSGYVSTQTDGAWKKLTSQFGMGYEDLTYEYINGEESGIRQEIIGKALSYDYDTDKFFVYDHMTEDQISTYNYYYAKDGKEAAEKYLKSIQETLNYQAASERYSKMEGKTALEIMFGIEAGADQFQSGIKNVFNTKDNYIPQSSTQMLSGMVREDMADDGFKLPDWLGGASIAQAGYDAITTTTNMLPSIMTSTVLNIIAPGSGAVVGSAMMGASAAGNAYQEMLNLGYDKDQARAYSTLVGASEAGLQYLLGGIGSLGGKVSGNVLTKMLNGIDNAFLRTALKLTGNILSEGLEEGLQEVLTPWFKNLIMNTDENINWSEVAYSSLLGALTAGFMEGPTTIAGEVKTYQTGKKLQAADISATRLAELGNTFSADTVAAQLAGRVNENTGAYTMGRLFNEIGATLSEQNVTDITNALVAKGMDQDTAKKNAKALAYVVEGGQLTDAQIAAIEANEVLADVARTTLIDANTTWNQRTQGYNQALQALADEMTAPKATKAKAAQQNQENAPATDMVDAQNNGAVQSFSEADTVDTSPAKVQTISSIANGQVTVKLEDGTEVNVKEADLSVDDGVRIETIAKLDGISATDANFILNTLRTNTSTSAQMDSLGAREAYKYGYYGFSDAHMATHGVFSNSLTEAQRKAIYDTGRSARQRQVEAKQATVRNKRTVAATGKVHFEGDHSKLTERQSASLTAMEKVADVLGVQIYVFESKLNERGKRVGANGWYDPKDSSIHIDLHAGENGAGTMLFTAAHELTHHIRKWSPAKFKALSDFLMQEYGKKGVNVDALVREQQAKAKRARNYDMSYDEAYEEVVADSMEMMLSDGNVLKRLEKLKAQDKDLWHKIKSFIDDLAAKIKAVYKGMAPDSVEGRHVADMGKAIYRLQELFAEGLVDASDNFQSAMENVVEADAKTVAEDEIITDGAVVTDGEGKKYSIRSMKQDIAEGQMFEDLKTYCGWTQKQVNELRNNLADLVEYMTPYRNILDMNETYGREGRRFSPYKPNSDPLYKISMDFSTLCSKRLLTQYVIENLQLRENRPMSAEEQMAIRAMLNEYRKVEKGLQVACAMCYVEAARLKSPKQITKWMEDPGTQMKNYFADKNPEFANFIKEKQADFKESRGYDRNATKKDMSPKDVRELNKIRPRLRSQYQLSAEEAKIIERAKSLPGSTYLTAGNLASLSETDPTIYAAYTAFVRTATRSKSLETDEPYYYGDSRRDNGNGIIVSDSFIEAVNRENGMRFSSWSDWRIQHLLDYIAAVIDNSVRGAAMHGYTKFGEEVRVLGKTGMMFNMSGVAGTQTGLNEDGSLSFSPTESIDVNEAIQLREEFPDTAGLQCIGVGDDHITALLRSDIIDYVIPYHVSGLNAGLRAMANIHGWKDYTSTQHAAIDKSIKFENAVDQEHWHEEPVYSEFFVGYDTGMTGIEAMRASADRYVQMCKDRGLKPKFEQFVKEDNYWKLLIDRKMVNQKTGKLIQQKPVTPTFDFDTVKSVVDQFVQNYDSGLEARALNHIVENWDSIPKRIRDLKNQGSTKAKKASKAVDTLANQTLAAQPTVMQSARDEAIELSDVNTKFSLREEAPPKRTIKAYKVFRVVDGKLYPPKIANLTDDESLNVPLSRDPRKGKSRVTATGNDTPVGVWINADVGGIAVDENGDAILNTNGRIKVYDLNGMKKDGFDPNTTLAFRPGWHLGSIPEAIQFLLGDGTMPDDLVFAECEIAADIDYQAAAMSYGVRASGKFVHADAGLPAVPLDGYYKYKTNPKTDTHPWFISGAIKVNRIIGDAERRAICAKEGITIAPRYGGKDIEPTDIWESGQPAIAKDLTPYKKGQKNYDNEKLLERTLEKIKGLSATNPKLGYIQRDLDFNSRGILEEIEKAKLDVDALRSAYEKHGFNPYYFDTDEEVKYSDRGYGGIREVLAKKGLDELSKRYGSRFPLSASFDATMRADNTPLVIATVKANQVKRKGKESPFKTGKQAFRAAYGVHTSVHIKQMGIDAELFSNVASESIAKAKGLANEQSTLDVIPHIRDILSNSILMGVERIVHTDGKGTALYGYRLYNLYLYDDGKVKTPHCLACTVVQDLDKAEGYVFQNIENVTIDQGLPGNKTGMPSSVNGNTYTVAQLYRTVKKIDRFDGGLKYTDEERDKYLFSYTERNDGVKYSDRDTESVSNRSLLANAFEGVAQNDIERQKIQEYKGKISLIESEERKLQDLNQQIKDLSFAKGPKDTKAIRDLQFEAKQTANRISTYDKQLLRLEASKPLQDVLQREKKMAYQRAEKKGKEALAAYREKTMKTQRELIDKWQESRKRGIENREKTAMRHKIQNVVGELNSLLLSNDRKRHVPDNLKKAVADALDLVNMDTVGAEERAAKYAALIAKETDPDKIDAYTATMENILRQGEKIGKRLKELHDAYEDIQNSDDPDIANAYDPVIAGAIKELSQTVGKTSLRDMTLEQLSDVYDVYRMVLTRVRDANKTMLDNIKENISNLASRVIGEVRMTGGEHKARAVILDPVKKFMWNNMKPVYAMEHIGSSTLTRVFNNVRAGEDVWAKDVTEAREYYLDKSKKYGYDSWDFKKKYRFQSASDLEFELTLEQILSLYAYSKREQAHDHLRLGGFVFDSNIETYKDKGAKLIKYKVNTADAHQVSPEILAEIIGTLSNDQKGFVDEMQDYLSSVMGAKGNEVTSKMYGVKLFKEKFYFPLKSAKQFMFEQNEVSGEVKIKNSGFTNKVVAKANNPVILSNFMEVWSGHVNDMSMYHAFTLPLEDFNRVFNYNSPKKENQPSVSVKGTIQNAYSPAAVHYVKQLITDLNGGARSDSTTGPINKLMGLFKKGAVFASLSVVVQQPSAIARAAALVDTKYFIGPKVDRKRHAVLWDEVKQYAPVAIIKEMGYFDTNMGKSTQDFILGKEYSGFAQKMKALFTDSGFRDEALSKAPALADEIAWCGIWEAVKRETKANNNGMDIKSEAFLKKCGERFTEVIVKTQVYDSILARSGHMRSKDTGMKMATSFMAEPTTSINMITDALLKGKRGNRKYARKAIGAVIASQILNSILVSFVYAGRDDDEDETYWEKYLGTLAGQTLDSLNPAGYIPFIKDIMSIVQGYDVERSDMAVISDLWKAYENLSKDYISPYRKVEGFAGSIAQIFGLPVKNIMRDARGIYQTIDSFVNGQQTTKTGIGYAVKSALPKWIGGGDVSNDEQLYRAIISGDQAHLARVKSRYEDEKAINTAMRSSIKEHFLAGNIDSETAMKYLVDYSGEKEDDAFWKVEEWMYDQKNEDAFSKYNELYGAVQTGKDLKAVIKKYTDNGVTEATLKSQISDHFKEQYIEMSTSERASIKGYLLNAMTLLGDDREDAEKKLSAWEFEAAYGFSYENRRELYLEGEITGEQVRKAVMDFGGKTAEEADEYLESLLFEAEYGFAYSDRADAYKSGEITAEELKHILMTAGGKTAEEANLQIQAYDWEAEGYDSVTTAAVRDYAEHCAAVNVPKDVFLHIRSFSNNTSNDVVNGKTIYYSAMKKIMAEINAQPGLTNAQKDALARSMGWAEKNIQKYKLW